MRPQLIAADNPDWIAKAKTRPIASMRPQLIAADNPSANLEYIITIDCSFNEAAAYSCG